MIAFYDRHGQPLEVMDWAALMQDREYQHLAMTALDDGAWVATVWLGLDLDHTRRGPPLIFETIVFPAGDGDGLGCWRWSTEENALAGHDRVVARFTGQAGDRANDDAWTRHLMDVAIQAVAADRALDDDDGTYEVGGS